MEATEQADYICLVDKIKQDLIEDCTGDFVILFESINKGPVFCTNGRVTMARGLIAAGIRAIEELVDGDYDG